MHIPSFLPHLCGVNTVLDMYNHDHSTAVIIVGGSCCCAYMLSLTAHCLSSVKHNPHSGNLRTLVKRCLELATNLRDESQCERLVIEVPRY